MASNKVFRSVGSLQPGRSIFDLSYDKKFDCDMGQLIPVMCDECVPGDVWSIGNQALVRFQPLVAPIMHEINMYVHYFFVPYRLLDEDFEEAITGGEDGQSTQGFPTWTPTPTTGNAIYSLWDYLGFPVGVIPLGALPLDYPRRAYNYIYNSYYRDENLTAEIALTNEDIKLRAWEKDYFTSSLPFQQRGIAPALPISGLVPVEGFGKLNTNFNTSGDYYETGKTTTEHYDHSSLINSGNDYQQFWVRGTDSTGYPDVRANLQTAVTFDVSDLRLAFQIQKWMERNARGGVRYVEFLKSHFGVSPSDERLQRPEYVGGTKQSIIISEVLQTSESATTPQGTLAGHGISATNSFAGKYRVQEFGLIMGIMSIMPRSCYQQGINRQWIKRTKYDFYFPEFAHLSEQAIERVEIYANGVANDNVTIFGYQGRYDEMRTKSNMAVAGFRSTYDYWHLGRVFGSAPLLNTSFVECLPRKDVFAVQDEPGLLVDFGNVIRCSRPLPIQAEPGLIDHN